jgi:hypothetical protein
VVNTLLGAILEPFIWEDNDATTDAKTAF